MKTKPNRSKIKKPDPPPNLVLEEVIGLTVKNSNGLASNVSTPNCVYVAGSVVVVYNVDAGTQSILMVSHRMPKPLSCVALSRDGRFVAAGESGLQSSVLVWDLTTRTFISELKGHIYEIACIAFSPDGEHLVSIGGYIYFWNWRRLVLITKIKASSSNSTVTSACFSSDAKFIVTAGMKHLRFWTSGSAPKTRLNGGTRSLTMNKTPVNLGSHKGSSFISVMSTIWTDSSSANCKQSEELFPVYALTGAGVLCLIDSGLSVRKSVDIKADKCFALSASEKFVACACGNGVVHLFTTDTLKSVGTLLYSHAKSRHWDIDIAGRAEGTKEGIQLFQPLPDALACQFCTSEKLVVVYGDHGVHIWNVQDVKKATRCCLLVSHSESLWDVKNICCENMHDPAVACIGRGCSGGASFVTCSADGTIRMWDLVLRPDSSENAASHHFSTERPEGSTHLVSAGIFERAIVEVGVKTQGLRTMAVSSDGTYLAAGDCDGNLHVYNLHTADYTYLEGAHDAEILSLSFSLVKKTDNLSRDTVDGDDHFLVSGGRDGVIHLYNVKRNFDVIETINDHSAAVTSVILTFHGQKLISCSTDGSVVFRDVLLNANGCTTCYNHRMACHSAINDMTVDPNMKVIVTVGQDKRINTFDIVSGNLIRSFKQEKDLGDPIKVNLDPSCSYLVICYSNKHMYIYDSIGGELIAQASGHSEIMTNAIFLPDCEHIVSVGADGCIFLWKIPTHLSSTIIQRMKEKCSPLSPRSLSQPLAFSQIMFCEEEAQHKVDPDDTLLTQGPQKTPTFRFSISRLPQWAQGKVVTYCSSSSSSQFASSQDQQQMGLTVLSPLIHDSMENAPASSSGCEAQTPSTLEIRGSPPCFSSRSSNSSNINKLTAGRWLNVYTVCMDLLNSPDVEDLKNRKLPSIAPNLWQFPVQLSSNGEHVKDGVPKNTISNKCSCSEALGKFNNHNQLLVPDTNAHKADSAEQSQPRNSTSSLNVDTHVGSLSTMSKLQRNKSSDRRRYSTKYFLRQDHLGGGLCGKFLNHAEDSAICTVLEVADFQDTKKSMENLHTNSTFSLNHSVEDSLDIKSVKANEAMEKIAACRKVLKEMDTAAHNMLGLFSDLRSSLKLNTEAPNEPLLTRLYNEAASLLPSIARKVSAVTNMTQDLNKNSCELEISGSEPLSQLVVEIER